MSAVTSERRHSENRHRRTQNRLFPLWKLRTIAGSIYTYKIYIYSANTQNSCTSGKHPPRLSPFRVMAVKLTAWMAGRRTGRLQQQYPKKVQVESGRDTARGRRPPAPRGSETLELGSSASKWSYQIVFPLDASRLTAAAAFSALFLAGTKTSPSQAVITGLRMPLCPQSWRRGREEKQKHGGKQRSCNWLSSALVSGSR